jgi:transposase-like protein
LARFDDLALGPAISARFESADSARTPPSESILAGRRNVREGCGHWAYLYRAVDSPGETIEFMLSPKRDLIAAKLFLRLALSGGAPPPRVINVDGHPAYPAGVTELKPSGELERHCRCRTAPYLNNVIEQDHRFVKKRIAASLGFRSAGHEGACKTIECYEAMRAIRKDYQ